jgi:hypothetical protein
MLGINSQTSECKRLNDLKTQISKPDRFGFSYLSASVCFGFGASDFGFN